MHPRHWLRRLRRWSIIGMQCGAMSALGLGCRSAESIPDDQPHAAIYPGLGAKPNPTAAVAQKAMVISHAAPISVLPVSGVVGGLIPPVVEEERGGDIKRADHAEVSQGAAATNSEAPAPPPRPEELIDLEVALRLAGVENPTINLARERVQEALAVEMGARSLLLPSVNIGGNYHLHAGSLQASPGFIRDVNSQSLYLGFGARTLAAESVAFPGVRLFAHLGDAFFEPLAARQQVRTRQSDALAVQNGVLLDVAVGYLELVGAEARLSVLRQGETDVDEIVRNTLVFAQKGQGRRADANRAMAHRELIRQEIHVAEGDVAIASARLCRLLNLDPSILLRTPVGPVESIRLVPEETPTEELVATAVRSRPEVFASTAQIQEAQTRVRQERVRPLVPLVSVGYSGGLFGGGSNLVDSQFGAITGRSDFDVFAVWNLQNLGLGNRARIRTAGAVVGQAIAGYDLVVNQVRREVTEAQAAVQAAVRQIDVAKKAVVTAEDGFALEKERLKQGVAARVGGIGEPIEALDSFSQLLGARQELVRAVVAFDIAQFRLFVSLGSNPLASPAAIPQPPIPGIRNAVPQP